MLVVSEDQMEASGTEGHCQEEWQEMKLDR